MSSWRKPWSSLAIVLALGAVVEGMGKQRLHALRQEAVDMFYHGFDNYMESAFPDDELRPISCTPLTRDPEHPERIGINDVLGNYSLTLIDTLSTLAVLASSPSAQKRAPTALEEFANGVRLLVENYGDGSEGPSGQGIRARGFDLDSKVQVFETVIRGVGGLLSAHLFAVGDLPILNYDPKAHTRSGGPIQDSLEPQASIQWSNGFRYDGQLLRLALDLGKRLLPAFYSPTGVPYPRVNLRHGIPFYGDSPLHRANAECAAAQADAREITETCSAGAGSLVLEFITLSRLTGDFRFEQVAKQAFWEVWDRRSGVGLVGGGLDAESGLWTSATTGIGAGVDSFFEYALKSHILLSGLGPANRTNLRLPSTGRTSPHPPSTGQDDSDAFLGAWQLAHAAIKRHLYRDLHHPHYVNAHLDTGSPMALWVDSLSAYYPGLLTLAGELEEAVSTNLLYSALWTRYSGLPERWSMVHGGVEGGLGWWPGRPELAESVYHLYRATRDPWYLYVGEMILRDIQRRCWTRCGWAGLQDVRTGELSDRMESFFLGETIKYLFLLFDSDHPLNSLDAPFVFSTEGHPLVVRKQGRKSDLKGSTPPGAINDATCPVPPALEALAMSAVVARDDFFHAASLTRLSSMPSEATDEASSPRDDSRSKSAPFSPAHLAFYPWTLPTSLVPPNGTSSKLRKMYTIDLQFPTTDSNVVVGQQNIIRTPEGLLLNSLGGLKLGLLLEDMLSPARDDPNGDGAFRIHSLGSFPLGRDEKIFIRREAFKDLADPNFALVQDAVVADLVVEVEQREDLPIRYGVSPSDAPGAADRAQGGGDAKRETLVHDAKAVNLLDPRELLTMVLQHLTSAQTPPRPDEPKPLETSSHKLVAIAASGIGACPLPGADAPADPKSTTEAGASRPWKSIYMSHDSCDGKLPDEAAMEHQVIVVRRGRCTFSEKLSNVPVFRPSRDSLQLVIVVSDEDDHIRPLLDEVQYTPAGLTRFNPIPMVMIGGGQATYDLLAQARNVVLRRRHHVLSQGSLVHNAFVV